MAGIEELLNTAETLLNGGLDDATGLYIELAKAKILLEMLRTYQWSKGFKVDYPVSNPDPLP